MISNKDDNSTIDSRNSNISIFYKIEKYLRSLPSTFWIVVGFSFLSFILGIQVSGIIFSLVLLK